MRVNEKKYKNKCDDCDFKVVANRKYELIQVILRHKETCTSAKLKPLQKIKTCDVCEYVGKDEGNLKRQKRDKHDILTVSTSPPPKKTKIISREKSEKCEEMDFEEESVKDLSFKLEDMDIDDSMNEMKERSKMMDEMIEEKRRKIEEEENINEMLKNSVANNKAKEEKLKVEKMKKLNKQRKQKKKDEKKRSRRTSPKLVSDVKKSKIPNIKPVPENCVHLVNDGDVVYEVPGNGSCGPNSASAFLFKDDVFGPKLRRRMNIFMAKHWNKRYQYITQCSKDHPFERKLGQGKVSYEDPLELVQYLETSEEAAYMWTDSEDLTVISDMYQVTIKVITTKGEDDENPTVNWISPEITMKEYSELKDVEMEEMVLLHQNVFQVWCSS